MPGSMYDKLLQFLWRTLHCRRKKRRRGGGVQQRLERSDGVHRDTPLVSTLASLLVQLWAWGLVSPQLLQHIARAITDDITRMNQLNKTRCGACNTDFLEYDDLRRLAKIGDSGWCENNMSRELVSLMPPTHIPEETSQTKQTHTQ